MFPSSKILTRGMKGWVKRSLQPYEFFSFPQQLEDDQTFIFLNIKHHFDDAINWNYSSYGKLWTYHLNYFEFLRQQNITKDTGERLILDWINKSSTIMDGVESYPTSLRINHWIFFILHHQISNENIDQSLYDQLRNLEVNLEWHLEGNHILENILSLVWGYSYFENEEQLEKSIKLLLKQLGLQLTTDGAHYELCPAYHIQIMVRLLDLYAFMSKQNYTSCQNNAKMILPFISTMSGWLISMLGEGNYLPMLGDGNKILWSLVSPIKNYINQHKISYNQVHLGESGYRTMRSGNLSLWIDIGPIGPRHIAGHGHADALHFVLVNRQIPIIVDPGISTYEMGKRRLWEKGTSAHNTVTIDGKDQSELWSSFRVGRRATVQIHENTMQTVKASVQGVFNQKAIHTRTYTIENDGIVISDEVNTTLPSQAHFHFHPTLTPKIVEKKIFLSGLILSLDGSESIELLSYDYCEGFNLRKKAKKAVVHFTKRLTTQIGPNENTFSD